MEATLICDLLRTRHQLLLIEPLKVCCALPDINGMYAIGGVSHNVCDEPGWGFSRAPMSRVVEVPATLMCRALDRVPAQPEAHTSGVIKIILVERTSLLPQSSPVEDLVDAS